MFKKLLFGMLLSGAVMADPIPLEATWDYDCEKQAPGVTCEYFRMREYFNDALIGHPPNVAYTAPGKQRMTWTRDFTEEGTYAIKVKVCGKGLAGENICSEYSDPSAGVIGPCDVNRKLMGCPGTIAAPEGLSFIKK